MFLTQMDFVNTAKTNRILICRPNHRLGNLLLVTPILQEVIKMFPRSKIDLLVQGDVAPLIFKNYDNIDRIIELPSKPIKYLIVYIFEWLSIWRHRYDLVINVVPNSSSGKIATKIVKCKNRLFGDEISGISAFTDMHMARRPVYNLRYVMNSLAIDSPIAPMDLKLGPMEIATGQRILKRLLRNEKKTIGLFTYATRRKCCPISWWQEFYKKLRTEYHDFNIIEILPISKISQLDFKVVSFYSENVREIGSVIANTSVFIAADSGIMHLADAAGTPTIGLFSGTNKSIFYSPYNNESVGIDTNVTSADECISILNKILNKNMIKMSAPRERVIDLPLTPAEESIS
jgi:ADP-heptose:LPS heptosyltransferase